jgi:hypothetical protein
MLLTNHLKHNIQALNEAVHERFRFIEWHGILYWLQFISIQPSKPSLWPHTQMIYNNNFRLISIAVAFITQKTNVYLINNIKLGNLSILEIPQEYPFFTTPRLLASFSMPLDYGYHFGVLCRCLQALYSMV